ncbi:hypothetical protein BpHYR1_043226 [Brachionus plicatilis]|uniref:Uncharacterized protein n=1 Tax=Brachionus plicatilis TaxID=10195 RepID=A0A3M7PJ25_BRAPC|nr:hypothetical protein BpHYR1_043226 [Brachionus plicatilis]
MPASIRLEHEFLINRIVTLWNSLPNSVIEVETLNKFKARLDEWFQNEWKLLKLLIIENCIQHLQNFFHCHVHVSCAELAVPASSIAGRQQ